MHTEKGMPLALSLTLVTNMFVARPDCVALPHLLADLFHASLFSLLRRQICFTVFLDLLLWKPKAA
jgi:hypothetical protein